MRFCIGYASEDLYSCNIYNKPDWNPVLRKPHADAIFEKYTYISLHDNLRHEAVRWVINISSIEELINLVNESIYGVEIYQPDDREKVCQNLPVVIIIDKWCELGTKDRIITDIRDYFYSLPEPYICEEYGMACRELKKNRRDE